jgi:hypothetical protein
MELIAANEAVRAPDLAARLGLETAPFKQRVRRLKGLGLTVSLDVGYRISPRGHAYLVRQATDQGGGGLNPGCANATETQ